jgi:hypothetical protein
MSLPRRRSRLALLGAVSISMAMLGCSSDEPAPSASEAPAEPEKKRDRSNVKIIKTAVPAGKTVACPDLFPDIGKFKELVADDIGEVKDRGKSNRGASAVCAFMRAGEPPKSDSQLRKMKQENMKLGVLPGDEYCTVTLDCTLAADEGDFKDVCEKNAKRESERGSRTVYEGNSDIGQFACVRKTDRPPNDWAFTYRTIDADTSCVVEVMGGPSVTDEGLVQNCTRAALRSVGMEHLKKYN